MNSIFIQKLTCLVEANLTNEKYGPKELAREAGMSHSSLNRKVRSILDQNSGQFIREIKLNKARELLQNENLTVAEISFRVGFGSPSYFNKSFHKYFGYSPGELRNHELEIKPEEKHVGFNHDKPKRTKILIGIIIGIIIILPKSFFLNQKFSNTKALKANEKSIAILPLYDDSSSKDNIHVINGFMEALLNKLMLIQNLNVVSRISAEKYQGSDQNILEIGKELNVDFLLVGSSQTIGSNIEISLQLIDVLHNKNLWTMPYKKEITPENIFDVQEEVLLEIVNILEIEMASVEREQLGAVPTKSTTAYNYYLLGKDFMNAHLFSIGNNDKERALVHAKLNLERAIELDSTFADAYSILGSIYIINLFNKEAGINWDKANLYLDSGLIMLDKALYYDGYNQQALASKAAYYELKGKHEEANPIYALISKNGYLTFEFGISRYNSVDDYYNTINNYIKYLESKPADVIVPPYILRMMIEVFRKTGFPEMEKQVAEQLLAFNNDTLEYFNALVMLENWQGNYPKAIDFGLEALKLDSTNDFCNLILGLHYAYLKDYSKALKYIRTYDNINIQNNGEIQPNPIAGFVYLKNGEEQLAESHFVGSIDRWRTQIEFNTHTAQAFNYLYELADIYLALGEKEKAMAYLKEMKKLKKVDRVFITILNRWPGFDSVRNDPWFQDLLKVLDAKYKEEHERVGELLKEKGFLKRS
jgi:AraC-like DNA-binding protein/TolB-like protein